VRGWLGSDTWRSARFRAPGDLQKLIDAAGLDTARVEGAVYYPPLSLAATVLAWLLRQQAGA